MNTTFEKFLAPVKQLNELTLKSIEQIAELQVKAIQENAKISIDAMQDAAKIKDLDSLKSYLESQTAVAQKVSENAAEDAREIADLTKAYAVDVKALVEKSVLTA